MVRVIDPKVGETVYDPGCGIVLDEGVLFRTNETAFVQTKRKLLDDCDPWCIVSLPSGTFVNAGAGVKTNLLFFTKGGPTQRIWYYDLSNIKVGKKTPPHAGALRRVFPSAAGASRQRTKLERDAGSD
jgi:type I restriction enzyme M protein